MAKTLLLMLGMVLIGNTVQSIPDKSLNRLMNGRKNVLDMYNSRMEETGRRRLGKSSSKWSGDTNDCECDSTSGKKNSSSGKKNSSSGKKNSSSGKKNSSSGKKNSSGKKVWRRRLGKSSSDKWSTDTSDCDCSGTTPAPSDRPTSDPTDRPTDRPSDRPTNNPTDRPSDRPTGDPTDKPTDRPSDRPTNNPTTRHPTTSPTDRPSNQPTDRPSNDPTDRPSDRPTNEPTDEPTDRPTERPTAGPTDRPSERPTDEPTSDPSPNPTDRPSTSPTEQPSMDPSQAPTPRCPEDSDYFILGNYWEMYLASTDTDVFLSGRYNQDGDMFINEDDSNLAIWFEEVGTDYVLIIGAQDDSRLQLYYKDLVSTWTDADNPLVDSEDENEWDKGDETLEFVTSNMTLYDCDGINQGSAVYTSYAHVYNGLSSANQQDTTVSIMIVAAGFLTAIFAAFQ